MHRRGRANGNWGPIIQLVTVSMMLQRQHGECEFYRHVAQLGSASGLGPEGHRFESCHADQLERVSRNTHALAKVWTRVV